jgi:pseudouridine synthase
LHRLPTLAIEVISFTTSITRSEFSLSVRLDKDSEGLILLTNDGDIVNKILRAGNEHEKEYIVTVDKAITAEFVKRMAGGLAGVGLKDFALYCPTNGQPNL